MEYTLLDHYARNRLHPCDRKRVTRLIRSCDEMLLAVNAVYELAGRGY